SAARSIHKFSNLCKLWNFFHGREAQGHTALKTFTVIFNSEAASLVFHFIRMAPVLYLQPPIVRSPISVKCDGEVCAGLGRNILRPSYRSACIIYLASENGIEQFS